MACWFAAISSEGRIEVMVKMTPHTYHYCNVSTTNADQRCTGQIRYYLPLAHSTGTLIGPDSSFDRRV